MPDPQPPAVLHVARRKEPMGHPPAQRHRPGQLPPRPGHHDVRLAGRSAGSPATWSLSAWKPESTTSINRSVVSQHDQDFHRLMNLLHGDSWHVWANDPTIQATQYPQLVSLTRLLASPTWRRTALQQLARTSRRSSTELRGTAAPHYQWTPNGSHRVRCPARPATHRRTAPPRPPRQPPDVPP